MHIFVSLLLTKKKKHFFISNIFCNIFVKYVLVHLHANNLPYSQKYQFTILIKRESSHFTYPERVSGMLNICRNN